MRSIFGSIILPAAFVPPWAYEGWAVYAESNFGPGPGGRLSEPSFRQMLRRDLLAGNLKRLDQASNLVLQWPGPLLWYQYGALFFEYLTEEYGQEAMVALFQNVAENPPWIGFAPAFKESYGISLQEAYCNWQAQLSRQVGPSSLREGSKLLNSFFQTNHPCRGPDGSLYYLQMTTMALGD